jgi:hypothetical protein
MFFRDRTGVKEMVSCYVYQQEIMSLVKTGLSNASFTHTIQHTIRNIF